MSFGELLTKIAVALTAYSAAQDGIWSVPLAWNLGGALVVASFIRDASIRWREAVRLMPGFGFWFVVTYLLTGPFMFLLQWNGVTFFRPWEAVFASGMIAMFFRGFMIVCESWSRWVMWFLGFDNKRLDATHRYFQQQRWEWFFGPRHKEPVQSEALVDDEVYDDVFYWATPWPKLFQNLRSTRSTELIDQGFPAHVVAAWLGHTVKIAAGHYNQVTDEHFRRAIDPDRKNDPPTHGAA